MECGGETEVMRFTYVLGFNPQSTTCPDEVNQHLIPTCDSRILNKTFSSFQTFQSTVHLDDFQFTAGDGQSEIIKTMLPLFYKIKLNYLSVRSDEETNISTSFITFLPCINLLGLFEHFPLLCTPSRTSSADSLKRLSRMQLYQKLKASPFYLKSPSLCLVNAILIYHRALSDTFLFLQLVWSCQHPLAPSAYQPSEITQVPFFNTQHAAGGGGMVMGEMCARWVQLWWILLRLSGLRFTH